MAPSTKPATPPTEEADATLPTFLDERGSTGLNRWGGYIGEERHPKLAGTRAMRVFREMLDNDATVGACFYVIRSLTSGVEFRLDPANESAEARDVQAFVESCLEDMSHTWDEFLSEVTSAIGYGFAPFETVYKIRRGPDEADPRYRSKYADGRIGWRKFAVRAQTSLLEWEFDAAGNLRGMWQLAPPDYRRVFIPIEKLVLYRPQAPLDNPEGRSVLRNAYRSWFMLKRLQEIEAVGIERDLSGLPVLQVPMEMMLPNAPAALRSLRSELETLVQKIRRDEREGVLIPAEDYTDDDGTARKSGYKLALLSTGGRRAVDVRPAIESYQRDIARTMLAEFIFLGTDPNGSRSLADSKTTTFASALGAWLDTITATFQRYVLDPLIALNGWPADLAPQLKHGDIEAPDLTAAAAFVTSLVNAGLITPGIELERHLRAVGGLPALDPTALPDQARDEEPPTTGGAPLPSDRAQADEPTAAEPATTVPVEAQPSPETAAAASGLNGAQVSSLIETLRAVRSGELPQATASEILQLAFSLDADRAARLLAPVAAMPPPAPAP